MSRYPRTLHLAASQHRPERLVVDRRVDRRGVADHVCQQFAYFDVDRVVARRDDNLQGGVHATTPQLTGLAGVTHHDHRTAALHLSKRWVRRVRLEHDDSGPAPAAHERARSRSRSGR